MASNKVSFSVLVNILQGFGHLLFLELRKRLQNVGIRSIFCWGDKESEGFWLKQGFSSIAQVDTKGRARRLPVKADIRKTLCFPGGSTLMVCHIRKELLDDDANSMKRLPSQPHQNSFTPAIVENERLEISGDLLLVDLKISNRSSHRTNTYQSHHKALVKDGSSREYGKLSGANDDRQVNGADCSHDGLDAIVTHCSQSTNVAKRAWEASLSSLKSKRVKGSQLVDCQADSSWGFISEADRTNPCSVEVPHGNSLNTKDSEKCTGEHLHLEAHVNMDMPSTKQCFRIMLMNIADDAKKTQLSKVIEDLCGTIAYDGSMATHVVTGKVRKTLNFCTALCSGAWVVSSSWLKESCREGRFVDESPHILNDRDYLLKYKSDLKSAVFRAKACPRALFKGYNICIAAHVQTPAKTLSAIVRSAGGNVITGLDKVNEASTTIFVTCEEDTEEGMMAAKKGKLASYVYEEACGAYGVYEDLQGIKDTLSTVRGLLLDADEKKHQQHALREWLRQIRNICSDAEDVLDGFELQDKRKKVVEASGSTRMKVQHLFSSSNPLVFRVRMAHQIKDIRNRLRKVADDGSKFGLVRINVDPIPVVQRREMTHSHVDASSVIGRKNDREKIIKLLKQPHPHGDGDGDGDRSLCVIPIVGIGGLGKTTLAKLVFSDKRIDELFQLKMWVCVSDEFDIKQIIIQIINSASASAPTVALSHHENINTLTIEQLQRLLRLKLSGQKFLLVLDDIWSDERAKWIELKDFIKVGAAGSKIIVTTRSNSIASMMGTVPSYVLEGLSPENCLLLFVRWAFKEGEEKKYPNLVEIGEEIVKKCAGVPLAVRTLGSSLFSKFDLNKWIFIRDSEIWNLEQKKDDILPALKLSYDQMPPYLRQCFACFSLYPKDYVFMNYEIISHWVTLGLVRSSNGSEKLEDIAREYIDELISRSFLQDLVDFGCYLTFKVHDLVHDLALYVAKEDFIVVKSHIQNIPGQVKHLSIVENGSLSHALFSKSRGVRTILFPVKGVGLDSEALLDTWVSRYKYLRYLDLSDSSFENLPNSIAKFEHLRFLNLSNNKKIKRLPNSICKLLNLQVLLLSGCTKLETLPQGLGKLISLRRLVVTTKQSVLPQDEFASLNHLQTLSFHFCHNLKFLFREQLPSLEKLYVHSCGSLESLPLYIFPELHTLYIRDCKMLNLSLNNESPIQKLRMKHLMLEDFPGLLTLPGWIEGTADTLETLEMFDFPNLKMLPECLTTMANLKRLYIVDCPQLSSLPNDTCCFTALEDLRIDGCPELCRKCRSDEYWPMIAHIKHIYIEKQRGEEESSH